MSGRVLAPLLQRAQVTKSIWAWVKFEKLFSKKIIADFQGEPYHLGWRQFLCRHFQNGTRPAERR
jgi:hypothetical protein